MTDAKNAAIRKALDEQGFPKFLELPFELQIMIWLEAFSKPSINFYTATLQHYADDKTQWVPMLKRVMPSQDDSAKGRHVELAEVCHSAERAFRIAYECDRRPDVDRRSSWLKTDVLCFTSKRFTFQKGFSNHKISWHVDTQTEATKQCSAVTEVMFKGFERAGLFVTPNFESVDRWPFGNGAGFPYCPKQLAGFIDCLPDIKEFYLVFGVKARRQSRRAHQILFWCKYCKSSALHVNSLGLRIRY